MNSLFADIGHQSMNKYGEQLCGDHIDVLEQGDNSTVIVLADGLGSGVKASILSTLTSKIISTMMAAGLSMEECVNTIADTLPICSVRGVAYSTFTLIHLLNNQTAEIYQYDNPLIIVLRDGKHYCPPKHIHQIGDKQIYHSRIDLQENDLFIAMSDGVTHAGIGLDRKFGWEREDIIQYLESIYDPNFSAKTWATILLEEVNNLYRFKPGDDTTVCAIRLRKREVLNVMFGPPAVHEETENMISQFLASEGKHVVCGGTTSNLVADYLGKELKPNLDYYDDDIPPTATLEGMELVTEGVITVNRVLAYAKDYLKDNESYVRWGYKKDGASQLCRMMLEDATDINFFIGRAMNPAHQNPNLPISFSIKMQLIIELAKILKKIGKRVNVTYY
ncbi:MAG: SpoIIE family protein phosphatase [Clostridia bacterium]|nr:SpoIIE family protein phosphatase [Clostridia bacterium]